MNFNPERGRKLIEAFLKTLPESKQRLLLLDYDGTLAPFRVERDQALPYPGVREILQDILQTFHTRVIIVSGRWSKDLIPLLDLDPLPEIWGSHGIERIKPNGEYILEKVEESSLRGLAAADEWINANELSSYCEEKPGSLVLHWRGLDEETRVKIHDKTLKKWRLIASRSNLVINNFNGGIELRVPNIHKGTAIRKILSETGWGLACAYLGDDFTDEDAFKAIRGSGLGILVSEKYRMTAADVWLKPPKELLQFLHDWHDISGGYR